jgi:hypothetical protein
MYILDLMAALNVIELILAVTIIGLAAIALAAVAPTVVQSANATADVMTERVGGEQGASNNIHTNTTLNNINNSNDILGSMFLTGEDRLTSFNRINETYTEITYAGNRTILPTVGVTTEMMNATETGNLTLKLQPNGITIIEGQSILVTKGGVGGNNSSGAEQQENATAILVDLNGVRPNDPRSSTGVAFFSTDSTGKLAFLDKMIAIYQVNASPVGTAIRMWEWKGADLPIGNEADGVEATIGNQTTTIP